MPFYLPLRVLGREIGGPPRRASSSKIVLCVRVVVTCVGVTRDHNPPPHTRTQYTLTHPDLLRMRISMETDKRYNMAVSGSSMSSYRNYQEEAHELVQRLLRSSLERLRKEQEEAWPKWPTGGEFTVERGEQALGQFIEVLRNANYYQ